MYYDSLLHCTRCSSRSAAANIKQFNIGRLPRERLAMRPRQPMSRQGPIGTSVWLMCSRHNILDLLLNNFLMYHSSIFQAWEVPKRPVEVLCATMPRLAAYQTAVETQTDSSGMRTHTAQLTAALHAHAIFLLDSCT